MIELQIVWSREGQFCLWGLDQGRFVDAAKLERLYSALTGPKQRDRRRRVLTVSLPGTEVSLAPALELQPDALLALLPRIAAQLDLDPDDGRVVLGAGMLGGGSLRFVALLHGLALEMIAGGRLLPGIARTTDGWRARWRTAPEEPLDRHRLELLAAAMPRSLLAAGADAPPGEAAGLALTAMLDHLVDAHSRRLLAGDPRRSRRDTSGRADTGDLSPLPAWLKALTAPGGGEIEAAEPSFASFAESLSRWALGPPSHSHATGPAPARTDADAGGDPADSTGPLPATSREPRQLTVTLRTAPVRPAGEAAADDGRLFALDGLCEFEWRVAVGDQRLTMAELRELAAAQLPLIQSDGRWTVVSPAQVNGALQAIERHGESGRAHAGELLRDSLALGPGPRRSEEAESPKPGEGARFATPALKLESEGWLRVLAGEVDRELTEPPQPIGLRGQLRPYQRRGFAWLDLLSRLGLGACLADDMGLGKTIQLLALLLAEKERAALSTAGADSPTLLICPVSVVGNWRREAARFAPDLRLLLHHGPRRLRGERLRRAVRRSDLVVTSYSIVTRDRDLLGSIEWDRIALDEAQNIKSRRARQTQAIRSLPARHRIALTGTPVENRLGELHSIMDFLNPGLLGSADAFKQQIARPIEQWRDPDAAAQLRQATAPFILRRLKTDRTIVPELPEKIEMRTDCLLTREQASLYQAVVDDLMKAADQPEGIARSGAILAALTRLKQVCNHPGQLLGDNGPGFAGRSGKLMRLEEILEEALSEGDRALCFTQFSGFGQRLAWHLAELFDREVPFLHGGSSREERDEMVARFQDEDGPSIFVLSLRAGGTGLNLTAANQVIHFDRWWNPAVEDQATDRAYRIGQKRNVQVRKLTCVGTVEERIDTLLDRKRDLAEMIVGSGESWITELDSARLRELVALSPEAVDLTGGAEPGDRTETTAADVALAA